MTEHTLEYDLGEVTFFNESFEIAGPIETLTPYQVTLLVWMVICTVPNVFLIYVVIKCQLCRSNFYFVIGNWSLANIVHTVDLLYFVIVPEANIAHGVVVDVLDCVDWIISTIPVTLALLFVFDMFVNSKTFCRYTIYNIWASSFINVGVSVFCTLYGYHTKMMTFYAVVTIGILSISILTVRTVVYSIRPSDEENYTVRLAMSSFCIISNFSFVAFLTITRVFAIDIPQIFIHITTFVIQADGVVNLVLLSYLDMNVRSKIYRIFRCEYNHLNVHFTKNESSRNEGDKSNHNHEEARSNIV